MSQGAEEQPELPATDEYGRQEPLTAGTEVETLLGFLEYQRATFAWKTGGLDAAGLATTLPPSAITIGGMVKHLSYVEDWWFRVSLHGHPASAPWNTVDWEADRDWEWHTAGADSPEQLYALWQESVVRSREATAAALAEGGMGHRAQRVLRQTGRAPNLRWIVTHMIEEYSRHNGHVDLIRESIDGVVGE